MTSEDTEDTQGQLRAVNLNIVSASLSGIGALLIVTDAEYWWEGVVLASGLVAALVAVARWRSDHGVRFSLPCLVVTMAVWLFGVLVTDSGTATYSMAVVATVIYHQLPRHRRTLIVGLGVFFAATVAARMVMPHEGLVDLLSRYLIAAPTVAGAAIALTSLNQVVAALSMDLEAAREREAELAVARERVRFASDLHDIQGHTLHVVKLKITLAEKLVHTDIGRVEEELREVRALVGDTIGQTKELAYAQRRLNLSAELENAKNLFKAAGIRVRVVREAEVGADAGELLGQVLRETTTNILRHAQAEEVRVTLSESGIAIVNDGARTDAPPAFRGLSTLRERVVRDGGEFKVEQKDGRFLTAAAFPHLPSDAAL